MKKSIFAFSLTLLFSTLAAKADTIVVGIDDRAFLPHYQVSDGEFKGIGADIILLFEKSSTHHLIIKPLSALELFNDLQAGAIDLRYPDNSAWQSVLKSKGAKTIFYSDSVVAYREGSLVPEQKNDIKIEQVKTIGIVRGYEPVAYLNLLVKGQVHAKEFSDLNALIRATLLGQVEAAYYNTDVALQRRGRFGTGIGLVYNEQLPSYSDFYHLSSVRHKDVIEEFNQFLVQNKSTIAGLKEQYQLR